MAELTYIEISRVLKYEPETGLLIWLPRPPDSFRTEGQWKTWTARYAGREAFTSINGWGYRQGTIYGQTYKAHRVAWLLATGNWPPDQVDHINGNRADNRLENLRTASRAQNARNKKRQSNNTSGANGVFWDAKRNKWRAYIKVNGSQKELGRFETLEAASSARDEAGARLGFSKRHGVEA